MDLNVFFLVTLVVIGLASIRLWMAILRRERVQRHFLRLREQATKPFGLTDVGLLFVFWIMGQLASMYLAIHLLGLDLTSMDELEANQLASLMGINAMGQLISTLVAVLIISRRYRSASIFGWQPVHVWSDVKIAGNAWLIVVPPILMIQWALSMLVPYQHDTLDALAEHATALTIACTWFAAVFVAPVCEEIFFRGTLQAWLQRFWQTDHPIPLELAMAGGWAPAQKDSSADDIETPELPGMPTTTAVADKHFDVAESKSDMGSQTISPGESGTQQADDLNPYRPPHSVRTLASGSSPAAQPCPTSWWPVLISAFFFAMVHLGQGAAPVPLFFFGVALGYLYRQTGSILPCILLHAGLNGFSMFWVTLATFFGNTP